MYLKSTLTVPKIKDLVYSPNEKYKNIFDTISHNNNNTNYTEIDLLPNENFENNDSNTMKNELKSFLKKQLNGNSDDIIGVPSTIF
jgi:Fe-S cluster biosynthesis and repair protein YggX